MTKRQVLCNFIYLFLFLFWLTLELTGKVCLFSQQWETYYVYGRRGKLDEVGSDPLEMKRAYGDSR